jgi:hypothetical protein
MVSRGCANRHESDAFKSACQADDADPVQPITLDNAPDCLRYVADMLAELRLMADRSGWSMLGALLALAHAEARAQYDRVVPRSAR